MDEYSVVDGKKLRWGFTTGSCATAAAKASTMMLLGDEEIVNVKINTPKGVVLNLPVEDITKAQDCVACAIRKDAGDDYDDTNGILIYAKVEKSDSVGITLCGGEGVGKVTAPGLSCKVGGPAINPTPEKMIKQELTEVMAKFGYTKGLKVTISVPRGKEIAKKTFNPRLGILDGISILGTSGIVEPMSEKALVETIITEINVQSAKGNKNLLVFFGNYGEDYARDVLKIDISGHITCSNFVGEVLDYAVYKGFESLLLIGHSGKLVKVAQGVMNTHSKYADCRTEILALEAALLGAKVEIVEKLEKALTTDEAIKILKKENLFDAVIEKVMGRIDFYMNARVHNKLKTAAIMFSNVYGVLGVTKYGEELIKLHEAKEQ